MARALGIDIGGVEDVDLFLSYVDGPRAAAEAVMRGLLHAPGKLWWAPDLGFDVRGLLHQSPTIESIERAVQTQVETDERVESAEVSAVIFGDELRITVNLTLTQDPTKVQFTLTVNQLGEVLDASVSV
jgi:hypothetical protein